MTSPTVGSVIYASQHSRLGCSLRRVAAQSLPDTTFTDVSWDTEDEDTDSLWSSGTTITIPETAVWAFTAAITLAAAPTGSAFMYLTVNGIGFWRTSFTPGNDQNSVSLTRPIPASTTVSVGVYADTPSGTTMTGSLAVYRVAL